MRFFPGTDIEIRSYRKWELAALLGISPTRLTYVLKQNETKLQELGDYTRKKHKLFPRQVRFMLELYDIIEIEKA